MDIDISARLITLFPGTKILVLFSKVRTSRRWFPMNLYSV